MADEHTHSSVGENTTTQCAGPLRRHAYARQGAFRPLDLFMFVRLARARLLLAPGSFTFHMEERSPGGLDPHAQSHPQPWWPVFLSASHASKTAACESLRRHADPVGLELPRSFDFAGVASDAASTDPRDPSSLRADCAAARCPRHRLPAKIGSSCRSDRSPPASGCCWGAAEHAGIPITAVLLMQAPHRGGVSAGPPRRAPELYPTTTAVLDGQEGNTPPDRPPPA